MKSILKDDNKEYRPWFQIFSIYFVTVILSLIGRMIFGAIAGFFIGIGLSSGDVDIQAVVISRLQQTDMYMMIQSVSYIIGIGAMILFYPVISNRSIKYMGLTSIKKDGKNLILGLVIGVLLVGVLTATLTLTGEYRFVGFNVNIDLLLGLIIFIYVGLYEEIMLRGAFQHFIYSKHSIVWAILIPSMLFSLMHLQWSNMGIIAVVNIFLLGVLFAMITYKTGNLWMAIGIHITWNYTIGNIFGIEVNGRIFGEGLIQMERTIDTGLNGGSFGLKGGYLCTILLCLVIQGISMMKKREV